MSPALVIATGTATGQVINSLGQPVAGLPIVAKLNAGVSTPQTISPIGQQVPGEVAAFTDPTGAWSLALVPNNNINPANTTYTIQIPGMPDVYVQLNDTLSHAYTSIAVNPTTAILAPVGQTIPGALTVTGLLTAQAGANVTGNLSAAGSDPWFDVKHPTYGAVGNGVADDAPAINAAITACQNAGGGVVLIPTGTYRIASALQVTANVRLTILGWGALLQPVANIDAVFVSQANGTGALGCEVYGLTIDGQSRAGVNGIHIRDTDRTIVRNCRVVNCTTGVLIDSVTTGRWAEHNAVLDTFIATCTTGIACSASSVSHSLGETHMVNIGITGCATGVALNNLATFYRCRLLGVTIWLPTNGVGVLLDTNVTDGAWIVDLENLQGTQTGLTGVNVTTNAVGVDTLDMHLGFTGTFATQVSDATGKGLVWSEGTHRWTTPAGNGFWGALRSTGDTVDRIRFATQFAGGGGMQFGNGTAADVNLYRLLGGALATDGAFKRGAQAPAFAASYTPDPTLGEVITMTLTGNITVNAPVNGAVKGVQVRFMWTQDGTGGRTITYNVAFHTGGGAALVTTLSTTTIDTFMFDGSVWRLVDRVTGQA